MAVIDLRSDTVTKPSRAMREAIVNAEVGDDVLGDDPTVKLLEQKIAALFEREAALYVPSGTMANQICLKVNSRPGWELLCERECHVVNYECAGPVVHSGLLVNLLTTERGMITAQQVRDNIRIKSLHSPETRMVALENTHNRHGGTIMPQDEILKVRAVCDEFGLVLHLDGARIWNVHAATGTSLAELTRPFDSVSVCLSKGLGAPVGSMMLGSADFIQKCLRERKLFGGGMRQVGLLAAAGIFALEHNLAGLKNDHSNAAYLGEQMNSFDGFSVDMSRVQTNIVIVQIERDMNSTQLAEQMKSVDVWALPFGLKKIRLVTHLDVNRAQCEEAIGRLREGSVGCVEVDRAYSRLCRQRQYARLGDLGLSAASRSGTDTLRLRRRCDSRVCPSGFRFSQCRPYFHQPYSSRSRQRSRPLYSVDLPDRSGESAGSVSSRRLCHSI